MNSLGMYFGQKVISIVELKGRKVLNNIQIPTSSLSVSGLEDKVPEEIKIVALLKDELRRNKIETRNATIALSGTDLIIRTFEIPVLPARELPGAIHFEVKKYIPFKIEDLVSDFQAQLDKTSRSYFVLFLGIKRETLEKYFSILSQLGIKINSIEYSGFGIFRLMKLSGFKEKGVFGIMTIDVKEENEVDFTVMENGIPLFSRDMKFATEPQEISKSREASPPAGVFEKLNTEMRISLDYYSHKFPAKKIGKFLFISTPDSRADIEAFAQRLDFPFRFIEPSKIAGIPKLFSLSFLKAYSSALSNAVKTNVKINILSAWEKAKQLKTLQEHPKEILSVLFSGFRLNFKVAAFAVLICVSSFVFGLLQKLPVDKELNTIMASGPAADVSSQAGYDDLTRKAAQYNETIIAMNELLKKQIYLAPQLCALSGLLPEEMWLEGFSFANVDNKVQFSLQGMAYLEDENKSKELQLIQDFLVSLKKNPYFNKYFKEINIISVDTPSFRGKTVTAFTISGTS